jgi:hypothetical protein
MPCPYEIPSPLGAGGMGEVWRARDTRLGREVAIKVLPAALAADPAVRARIEREARTISSLNHPHICTLYDVGREGDLEYLVIRRAGRYRPVGGEGTQDDAPGAKRATPTPAAQAKAEVAQAAKGRATDPEAHRPEFWKLHGDPRWLALIRKLGLEGSE